MNRQNDYKNLTKGHNGLDFRTTNTNNQEYHHMLGAVLASVALGATQAYVCLYVPTPVKQRGTNAITQTTRERPSTCQGTSKAYSNTDRDSNTEKPVMWNSLHFSRSSGQRQHHTQMWCPGIASCWHASSRQSPPSLHSGLAHHRSAATADHRKSRNGGTSRLLIPKHQWII
jgi:hypothetical protein